MVFVADSEPIAMLKCDGVASAHEQGLHLVHEWPSTLHDEPVFCNVVMLDVPVLWEEISTPDPHTFDEELWFTASCGSRDFLVGNAHTFVGRMEAWCPSRQTAYAISLDEISDMSEAARYFIKGLPTETGQHGAGLRARARDLRQQSQTGGYLPEINGRLLQMAKRWEARARRIDYPGRR